MEELELFKQSTERAEVEVSSLKQTLSELEARMVETTAAHDTTLTEVKESAAEEVKFIKADQEIALRDLQVRAYPFNAYPFMNMNCPYFLPSQYSGSSI